MEKVRELAYLCDRVSAGGGCDAPMITRTRCGWAKFAECGDNLYGRRFHPKLKEAVYEGHVQPTVL